MTTASGGEGNSDHNLPVQMRSRGAAGIPCNGEFFVVKQTYRGHVRASHVLILGLTGSYFLRRLIIPSAARPITIPARIDSQGNPGIAGADSGVMLDDVEVGAC